MSYTIFDAGLRKAAIEQYVAEYNADLYTYRQTVLTAFQQVEDDLAATRILSQQAVLTTHAVASAQQSYNLELSRFQTGIDPYINVVTSENNSAATASTNSLAGFPLATSSA